MPAAWIGAGAAVFGAASSAMSSPSTSGGQSYYIPTGLASTDTGWQGLQNSTQGTYYNNTQPQNQIALGAESAGINAANQYGGAYQNAANAAGGQYGNLSSIQQGYGAQLGQQANQNYGTQQGLLNAGYGVYQTAMDPQSALYNRTAQQLQDQTGATNSMYGLGSSAAGAGVANQAMSNFNIDWQNQQLQRQAQGLSAYTGAAGAAGNYGQLGNSQLGQASGMYGSAAGNTLTAGQVPYQAGQTISATPGNLANTYGSYLNQNVYGPAQSIQSQAIPYMNAGIGAQALPYQNAYNNAQATGGAVGSAIQGIGNNPQVQQSLSNAYSNYTNPASGSFSGGNFSGAFNSSPYYSGGGNSYGFTM